MTPPHKWIITWLMHGPIGTTIGTTAVTRGYSVSKGKDIILKYRGEVEERTGVKPKIKPSTKWMLDYALDVFKDEFEPKGCTLYGIEVEEKETRI